MTHNKYLSSDEGYTRGDVAAMGYYSQGIQALTKHLSAMIDQKSCKQNWYADDSTAVGRLEEMRRWWDELADMAPNMDTILNHQKLCKTSHYFQRLSASLVGLV